MFNAVLLNSSTFKKNKKKKTDQLTKFDNALIKAFMCNAL